MQIADFAGPNGVVDGLVSRIEATHEPSWIGVAAPRIAAAQRLTRSRLRSIGFSQRTGFPAATACSSRSACVSVAVAIRTASTSGDAKISAAVSVTRAPVAAATLGCGDVDVLHDRQTGSRVCGDVGGVHGANAAAAEHSDSGSSMFLPVACLQFLLHLISIVNIRCAGSFFAIRQGRRP